MGYSNWASGQPGRFLGIVSMEDCALMRQEDGWKWHDYLCGSMKFHYYYICQFRETISCSLTITVLWFVEMFLDVPFHPVAHVCA